jgi:hypothetical protein
MQAVYEGRGIRCSRGHVCSRAYTNMLGKRQRARGREQEAEGERQRKSHNRLVAEEPRERPVEAEEA